MTQTTRPLDRMCLLASASRKLFDPTEDLLSAGERLTVGGNLSELSTQELLTIQNQITQILLKRMGVPRE